MYIVHRTHSHTHRETLNGHKLITFICLLMFSLEWVVGYKKQRHEAHNVMQCVVNVDRILVCCYGCYFFFFFGFFWLTYDSIWRKTFMNHWESATDTFTTIDDLCVFRSSVCIIFDGCVNIEHPIKWVEKKLSKSTTTIDRMTSYWIAGKIGVYLTNV